MRRSHTLRLAATLAGVVVALATATSSIAASFNYLTQGGWLFRNEDQGQSSSARALGGGDADWRPINVTKGPGQVIRGIACDPVKAGVCFVRLDSGQSDRVDWRPIDVSGQAVANWPTIQDVDARIEDFDEAAGLALIIAERSGQPKRTDLVPGLYLLKRGGTFETAQRLSELNPNCINSARFVRGSSAPLIILFAGCAPNASTGGVWVVFDADGRSVWRGPGWGLPLAIDGQELVGVGPVMPGAMRPSILQFRIPADPRARWTGGLAYQPDPSAGRPMIAMLGPQPLPPAIAILNSGRVIAVSTASNGPNVFTFCGGPGPSALHELSPPLGSRLGGVGALRLDGNGAATIATATNLWGQTHQFLLTERTPPTGQPSGVDGCGAGALQIALLPNGDPPTPPPDPLQVERRAVITDDKETVPYAVLGDPGSSGPIMVRAYGGRDEPVDVALELPLDQAWVRRGGRLVIATVRGDAKDPPWVINPTADYKVRAAKDLIAVVQDLIERKEATAGEVTVVGGSEGAFTVAQAALMRPDLFSTAVLVSGPFDLANEAARTGSHLIGPPAGGFPAWFSAGRPSDRACARLRFSLYAGGLDNIVDPKDPLAFAQYVKGLGYRGTLRVYPNAGHYLLADPSLAPIILTDLDDWAKERAACPTAPDTK